MLQVRSLIFSSIILLRMQLHLSLINIQYALHEGIKSGVKIDKMRSCLLDHYIYTDWND
jgi:hypothetical protein